MALHSSEKKIGVATATIVGMNAMIGAGVFAAPAILASKVGPAGMLTYAFVILAVWCIAISFARVASLYPEEGSFYTYTKQWGGHTLGVVAAGAYIIGLCIAMGFLADMAGVNLHKTFPMFSETSLGLFTLMLLIGLNLLGVVFSEGGQIVLIICTVAPIILSSILCLFKAQISNLFPFMPFGVKEIFSASKAVIFSFFGFECAASLFNIVQNPKKNVPKALTYAIILVGALYLLFVISLILAVPLNYFQARMPLSSILENIFPHNPWLISFIHVSSLSAIIGTLHSMIWSLSALVVSFIKKLKRFPIKKLSLQGAVLINGAIITLSFLTLSHPDLFFSLTAILIVFAYSTSIITLLTLPAEWKSGQNLITIGGLITALIIVYFAGEGLISQLQHL